MWVESHHSCMSADQQYPMGMRHMTVVPENFEPFDAPDLEDADEPANAE